MPRKILFVIFLFQSCLLFAQSRSKLDSLKSRFDQETSDSLKIVLGIEISRELHRNQQGEEEEYAYAQKAIEDALHLKDTLLYARALDNFGLLYRFHQHYREAIDFHIKAFNLVESKKVKPYYKMRFANNAAVAYRYVQKYATSVFYFMKALKIAEKEDDLRNISISNTGIGNALSNIPGREDEALQYFLRAIEAEKKRGKDLGIAINYQFISGYYIDKEDYTTARDYLSKLLQLNKEIKNELGLAITHELLGVSYMKEGRNLTKAASSFENALGRFKVLNNLPKQAAILKNLGNVQLKRDNLTGAENYFQKSLALAKKLQQYELVSANSIKLCEISEKKNNYQQALRYYKQANTSEDSIKLTDQNVRIEMLTRKYNIEKKESQIQLLQKDKALQQTVMENQKQKLEQRRLISFVLAVGLLLLFVIFLMQYRNYRTKKKTNARIQKKEKERMKAIYERNLAQSEILVTRLQINPHFLFNSLNAITYLIQSEQNSKAIKYLKIFSKYTRMVLETSKQDVISLQQELKLANYYLILEENRFEDGFKFRITGSNLPEIEEVDIPPLLLQPFIENAIWHGLLPSTREQRMLDIVIVSKSKSIEITIDDNGVGRKAQENQNNLKKHKSMGMQIIKERIQLYNKSYAEKISYKIIDKKNESGQTEGTRVVLVLLQDSSVNTEMKI